MKSPSGITPHFNANVFALTAEFCRRDRDSQRGKPKDVCWKTRNYGPSGQIYAYIFTCVLITLVGGSFRGGFALPISLLQLRDGEDSWEVTRK
jgi:hypothetical protein